MKRATLLLVVLLFVTAAFAREDKMKNAAILPAAQGVVITDNGPNDNTSVEIHVHHLARPQQLSPAKQSYVVWIQPRGQQPINAGQITVDDNLDGKLTSRTPYKVFDVFITAEETPTATAPSGERLLETSIDRQ